MTDAARQHAWLLDRLDAFLNHGDAPDVAWSRAVKLYAEIYFDERYGGSRQLPAPVDARGDHAPCEPVVDHADG
jgi:hypothetical protein